VTRTRTAERMRRRTAVTRRSVVRRRNVVKTEHSENTLERKIKYPQEHILHFMMSFIATH
jgi:hypothetical protein